MERIEKFNKIIEFAKNECNLSLNIYSSDFYAYTCILDMLDKEKQNNLNLIENMVQLIINVWLKQEASLEISTIADYIVKNWDNIQDMNEHEIIEKII